VLFWCRAVVALALSTIAFSVSAADRLTSFELLPRVIGPSPGYDRAATIATSGDGYLVVWSSGDLNVEQNPEIRAARVSRDGELLDPVGFRLGKGPAGLCNVVWNGEFYLVTWSGWFGWSEGWGAYMRRVAPDGTLLDPAPVKVETGPIVTAPVWNGRHFLLLTQIWFQPLKGVLLDRELRPAGEPFEANLTIGPTSNYSARFDGYNFIIVFDALFENRSRIFATILSGTGQRLITWQQIAVDATDARLGGIGRRSYVSWQPYDGPSVVAEIGGGARVVRGPVPLPSSQSTPFRISESRSGDSFATLLQNGIHPFTYRTIRVSSNLAILGERFIGDVPIDDATLDPDGSGAAVFAAMPPGYGYDSVYFDRFGTDVVDLNGGTLVSRGPSWQENPSITFDGTNLVATWLERSGDAYDASVMVTRIDAEGRSLDGAGVTLTRLGGYDADGRTAVAARDGESLLLWAGDDRYFDQRTIFATRMASDGSTFDHAFVVAAPACGRRIHSGASKTHFLTVWEHCATGEIGLVATPRRGTVSTSRPLFGIADRHGYDVACGEDECLVAVAMRLPGADWRIETMRVSNDGIPIESFGRVGMERCMAPALASDGASFLLTCSDSSTQEIRSALIRDGIAAPAAVIGIPGDAGYAPDADWTGRNYAVVWHRLYQTPATLLLRRVAADGTPLGTVDEVARTAQPAAVLESQHAVVSRGTGDVAIVWTRHPLTLDVSSARLWMMLREQSDIRPRPARR
jgi:hypothetical protein